MPLFNYTARDKFGQQRSDMIESANREAAVALLRSQGLLPIKLTEQAVAKEQSDFSWNPLDYRSINTFDIELEFHQIAVMLRSGISLLDALEMAARHARLGTRKTWQRLAQRVQQGSSFTDALKEHSIFSEFTIQLIFVGEQTGHLHTVMDQASEELKSSRKIRKQVTSALKYPAFTLLMAIGLVVFMLTKLIPEIKKLLKIMGTKMPPITQALIDTSDWFQSHYVMIIIVSVFTVVTFIVLYAMPTSRWWIDKLALRVPLFGYIFRLSATVLFSRAMGLLLRSGVTIMDSLGTLSKLHRNSYIASRVLLTQKRVMQGSSLSEPLQHQSGFMPLMVMMMQVGERSGTLDEVLLEMTDYHDELLQQAIARLTGMIAPMMTIFVGGMIGFVYAAFLVAMFSAAGGKPS